MKKNLFILSIIEKKNFILNFYCIDEKRNYFFFSIKRNYFLRIELGKKVIEIKGIKKILKKPFIYFYFFEEDSLNDFLNENKHLKFQFKEFTLTEQFFIETGLGQYIEIIGELVKGKKISIFKNFKITNSIYFFLPKLNILYFDIETTFCSKRKIILIGCILKTYDGKLEKKTIFNGDGNGIEKFNEYILKNKVDVLIGFHSDNFDLQVIKENSKINWNRFKEIETGLEEININNKLISICGYLILDARKMLKNLTNSSRFSLNNISIELLKDKKIKYSYLEIGNFWKNLKKLSEYCMKDVELTKKIIETNNFLNLFFKIIFFFKFPLNLFFKNTIRDFLDTYILSKVFKKNFFFKLNSPNWIYFNNFLNKDLKFNPEFYFKRNIFLYPIFPELNKFFINWEGKFDEELEIKKILKKINERYIILLNDSIKEIKENYEKQFFEKIFKEFYFLIFYPKFRFNIFNKINFFDYFFKNFLKKYNLNYENFIIKEGNLFFEKKLKELDFFFNLDFVINQKRKILIFKKKNIDSLNFFNYKDYFQKSVEILKQCENYFIKEFIKNPKRIKEIKSETLLKIDFCNDYKKFIFRGIYNPKNYGSGFSKRAIILIEKKLGKVFEDGDFFYWTILKKNKNKIISKIKVESLEKFFFQIDKEYFKKKLNKLFEYYEI